jgi:hypothetical protein
LNTSLGCLISPALDELATQLLSVVALHARERDVVLGASRGALFNSPQQAEPIARARAQRGRVKGRLTGEDPKKRWEQFLELSSEQAFMSQDREELFQEVDPVKPNRRRFMFN